MKRIAVMLCLGILAPIFQSTTATFVSSHVVPDLSMLMVVALGLCWRSTAGGLVLACALGFATDMLSGALLGSHALLRVVAFSAARIGGGHFNLRAPLPQALFVAGFTVFNAAALGALADFFTSASLSWVVWGNLGPQILVNAFFGLMLIPLIEQLAIRLGAEDAGRRMLRLEPRRRAA